MAAKKRTSAPVRAPGAKIRRGSGERIIEDLPLWFQLQRIGGKLTPSEVSGILGLADSGYCWRLVDLANEARQKDGHLQAVLQTRELALSGLSWQIVPCGDRAKDRRAAEWCEDALRSNFEDFPRLIAHLVGSGRFHGFAVSEPDYRKIGGELLPVGARHIPCRRFVFALADGRLHQWDANGGGSTPYPGINLQEEYPGRFIQFQPRTNGDIAAREGLSRVLVWAALWRNWDIKDWLALGELAWKPYRLGKYKVNDKGTADQKTIDNLKSILKAWSSSGVAIVPETTEIEIQWPAGASSKTTHAELFSVIGSEMSKAVLGQTLTTEQGNKGSQALGRVHDNVRRDILEADATEVSAALRRDLLTPMVRMNLGADVAVPELRFLTEDGVELGAYAAGILNLRKAGLRIAAKDVREKLGLSEPDEDEELLGESDDDETDPDEPGGEKPKPDEPTDEGKPGDGKDDAADE